MKTFLQFVLLGTLLLGCSTDDTDAISDNGDDDTITLATLIQDREIATSSVIACAGSTEDGSQVRVYLYPRPGVTNIRYFETENSDINPNDFNNYTEINPALQGLFNDFLRFFEVAPESERWVVVTFEEEGVVNISNPIRLKHLTQATEYLPENVVVSNEVQATMPQFNWIDGTFDDTIIYFQIVSNEASDLLSGTYTLERTFQYYILDNVVLNITPEPPPNLDLDTDYTFTLLTVTEDNWVNLFSEVPFRLE